MQIVELGIMYSRIRRVFCNDQTYFIYMGQTKKNILKIRKFKREVTVKNAILLVFSINYMDFDIMILEKNQPKSMGNSKIIEGLKALNRKEFRKFGEFVSSPYFNKNENVINLYNTLSDFYPEFDDKKLNLEYLFKKIFIRQKYDYYKINNITSDLFKLFENFLIQINTERDEFSGKISFSLVNELRQKELYRLYEHTFNKTITSLNKESHKDRHYYHTKYELYNDYLYFAAIKKPNTQLNLVQTAFDNLLQSSVIDLMKFYILMIHENNQTHVDYDMPLYAEILGFARKVDESSSHSLQLISVTLLLVSTKDPAYFFKLINLKDKFLKQIKFEELQNLYLHLCSFCAYMVNFKREENYNGYMFDLYKNILEYGLMTKSSFLYPNFMNFVKIACRVNEFKWAEWFIEEYKSSIIKEEKQNVLSFCYGTIEYSKGNYKEALRLFTLANFQNFLFKVQVRINILNLRYKLGQYDEALGAIDTFRHYIKRETNLVHEHISSYNTYLKLVGDFIRYHDEVSKKEKEFLRKKIITEANKMPANPFRIKSWILEETALLK